MRIITGKARNIPLKTLEGDDTRPTSERVKEAVFSMLQFEIEGRRVLDLFAGSGQLGLEAEPRRVSRDVYRQLKSGKRYNNRKREKSGAV